MSKDSSTPRVYLLRHGATAWSFSGRYTGTTDIPLLPIGESQVLQTASVVFGTGKLIDPSKLARVYVSPRSRAKRTLELCVGALPTEEKVGLMGRVREEERVREWAYGDYEGLLPEELKKLRRERGWPGEWDIWRDGTEGVGSEGPEDVARRIDGVIEEIVELQGRWMERMKKSAGDEGAMNGVDGEGARGCDVLVVAHGHSLRAFVKRWLGLELQSKVEMMLEPGGVCGLSYAHHNVQERAVLVGMSFPQS